MGWADFRHNDLFDDEHTDRADRTSHNSRSRGEFHDSDEEFTTIERRSTTTTEKIQTGACVRACVNVVVCVWP